MFDQSLAFEDTEVVDVEEPPPIAMGRVATEDLIVHVKDENGFWHRRHPVKLQTSCGMPWTNWNWRNHRPGRHIDPPLATVRPYGEPCDCWTRAEREEAAESDRLRIAAEKGSVL
jgi:hypothetical protein